jgi:adenylate cyclase
MKFRKQASYLFVIIFLLGNSVFSQDSLKVDSLVNKIAAASDDTNKVKLLMDLSRQYSGNNEKKVENYLNKAIILAVRIGYNDGTAKAISQMGSHFFRTAKYMEAVTASQKAAEIFRMTGDQVGLSYTYNNIGNVYFELDEYKSALNYQFIALWIQKELKSERAMASTMTTIGNIFQICGCLDTAEFYFEGALRIQEKLKNELAIAKTYNFIGTLYLERYDTTKAYEYFLKSEKIYEKKINKSGLSNTLCNIGNLYLSRKSYSVAAEYFLKSISLAEMAEAKETLEDAYYGLAEAYEKMNRFEDALKFYRLYNESEDSIFDIGRQNLINMQYDLETEKSRNLIQLQQTELENKELEIGKQSTQVIALAIVGFLLIALSILAYTSYKRQKKDHDLIVIEKKRSEDLLLNILPHEVAEELKQNGKSQARKIDFVTVLFADFIGFSKYAGILDPEELVRELDYYFRAFDDILNKYDIEKIKTIGDAYMCAGGVPGVNTSNPLDVVNCGLEIRDFADSYKKQKIDAGKPFLEMRIGIHTGPVVAGIVGVKKFSYDIWGDTVNIASRLQSAGQEGKVNISDTTYQYVKNNFSCEHRGMIPVKNIGNIEMYFAERLA